MRIVHLTASAFFGGPERQMLGLAGALGSRHTSSYLAFAEGGNCAPFLAQVARHGYHGERLAHDTPRVFATGRTIRERLRALDADLLICHGYKANLLGRPAARRLGIPVVAVARGWTGETRRVRFYDTLDRLNISRMDRVIAVSAGHAAKVKRCRVPAEKLLVIRNAARNELFLPHNSSAARQRLLELLPTPAPADVKLVVAAGRLSPEKGFDQLIAAAREILGRRDDVRFLLFGAGALREELAQQAAQLNGRFVLAGFRSDLDTLWPGADVMSLPSYTEGLPNVVLEASACGVPVVATAVGGTPEVVVDGRTGYLVPPGDAGALAAALDKLIGNPNLRQQFGAAAREYVRAEFSFTAQAERYEALFAELCPTREAV